MLTSIKNRLLEGHVQGRRVDSRLEGLAVNFHGVKGESQLDVAVEVTRNPERFVVVLVLIEVDRASRVAGRTLVGARPRTIGRRTFLLGSHIVQQGFKAQLGLNDLLEPNK